MTRRRNYVRNDRTQDHRNVDRHQDRNADHVAEGFKDNQQKKQSRGSILLKSTVFALFIVLVVLIATYAILKSRNPSKAIVSSNDCKELKVNSVAEVDSVQVNGNIITILTKKDQDSKREIINLDLKCGKEISRIKLKITN